MLVPTSEVRAPLQHPPPRTLRSWVPANLDSSIAYRSEVREDKSGLVVQAPSDRLVLAPFCKSSDARSRDRPAIIGFAESGGLGIFLRTEPAIGAGQRRITAARLQVIDPYIARHPRAQRIFPLHAATGRHRRFVRKEHVTDFALLVRAAGATKQRRVLLPGAEFARRDKATLPEPKALVLRAGFIVA